MYNHHNTVSDFLHQPQQAFLFVPYWSQDDKIRDDYKIGGGKKIRRLIFQGWAQRTYTRFEIDELNKLQAYLKEKRIVLDERWNTPWRLRYLLSTNLNIEKCLQEMKKYQGHIKRVKEISFSRQIIDLLSEGVFYVAGKDSHYRPIIVYNVEKIVSLNRPEDQLLQAQIYLLQYVIKHYLIPGQVENWVALIDSGFQGLFSLIDTMKKAFSFLADNYRCRLFACYNVRITTSISIIWGIVKKFLQDETVQKINLFDQSYPQPLFQYCNPSQVQVKFGGTMPNIPDGQFWPPRQWSDKYKFEKHPVNYMTRQQYTEYYQKDILRDTKIHEELIIKPASTELRENEQLIALKKIEREFRIGLQSCQEDSLSFNKHIEPFAKLGQVLNYSKMIEKE